MINNFLIINCIGRNDKIGLKVNDKFFIHDSSSQIKNKELLVINILNLIKKHKVNLSDDFSILVNSGPGRFSSMRISLAVAKGIKLSKKIKLFGFKDRDLGEFCLANIELLIKNDLLQNNLIKPLYLS
jgi:tRNA A37 threonylcarbamoyladenosine modification protein TsaB